MLQLKTTLSVVVIGRNEGPRLTRCLESVKAAAAVSGELDLVYVDSRSEDDSVQRAERAGCRVVCLESPRLTAALARNAGWRSCRSEWILFLDGDTILNPGFLPAALDAARRDSRIAAVWGHRRELHPKANAFHRVLDLDWRYAPGETEFCGGDALFRRGALEKVDGFDESLIAGEEPEMCSRLRALGFRILHIDQQMTLHDLAISRWRQYWRRASRAGYAYAQMARRTRNSQVHLWIMESRGNFWRGSALITLLLLAALHPALALFNAALFTALCVRSSIRARWKSDDRLSLMLYGVHSHVQQIPILAGQLAFFWDLARNRSRQLIEYK